MSTTTIKNSNRQPSHRRHIGARHLIKKAVETDRAFLGRRLTRSEVSGAAYFTWPLKDRNHD